MKKIIKYIEEALLSKKDKSSIERVNSDDYFDAPPMNTGTAHIKLGYTQRDGYVETEKWHNEGCKNIESCSDAKLIVYYEMCQYKKYEEALEKLEQEANRRGWTFKKNWSYL